MHKQRLLFLLLPAACTLLALSACQTTESKKRSVPPKLEILRAAVNFRQVAAGIHSIKAIEKCQGTAALAFITDGEVYRKSPVVWSYFFCGAMVLGGHMESTRPVIAFYNPFLDGVLVTQWTREDGVPRMLAADLRIGSEMAGRKSANPKLAWWLTQINQRPLPVVLHEQYAAFVKAFTQQFPVESSTVIDLRTGPGAAAVRKVIEGQAAAAYASLVVLAKPGSQTFTADLGAMRQALRSGDAQALAKLMPAKNPMSAAALVQQPACVRQQAVPIYALTGSERTIVILAPVSAPRYYFLAEWAMKPTRRLDFLAPFDMDGTPRPDIRKPVQPKEQP